MIIFRQMYQHNAYQTAKHMIFNLILNENTILWPELKIETHFLAIKMLETPCFHPINRINHAL